MSIETNKAIIRRFMEAVLNGRDLGVLDEILAEDYLDHVAFPGQEPGRRGVKRRISYLLAALVTMEGPTPATPFRGLHRGLKHTRAEPTCVEDRSHESAYPFHRPGCP